MKLQLVLQVCFFALSSTLAAMRPSRLASGLSSARINNYGARDDDLNFCERHFSFGSSKRCWECEGEERCLYDADCWDDDDDDDDREYCVRGHCCEFEGKRCRYDRDCYDDDDDD